METEEKEIVEVETKVVEETPIEEAPAKNEQMDKAYTLFAEFHGVLDEQYSHEQKLSKYKELTKELASAFGYDVDSEITEYKTKLSEYENKAKELENKNGVLEKLAAEFKKAKYAASFGDKAVEEQKSPQEIYDSLDPIAASKYLNSLRQTRR